jgi:hypothetical protein
MEHRDTSPPRHGPRHETALEEIARETRETSWWSWAITGITSAALLSVMYVVTIHRADEDAARHAAVAAQIQSGKAQDVLGSVPRPGGA